MDPEASAILSIGLVSIAIVAWDLGRRYIGRDSLEARQMAAVVETLRDDIGDRITGLQLRIKALESRPGADTAQLEAALTNLAKQTQAEMTALNDQLETLRGEAVSAARLAARAGRRK